MKSGAVHLQRGKRGQKICDEAVNIGICLLGGEVSAKVFVCKGDIIAFGFLCKGEQANYFKMREWVKVTANIKCEYYKEYEGVGPVLYLEKIELTKKPEEHLLYMN